jgi:hypothetical protein
LQMPFSSVVGWKIELQIGELLRGARRSIGSPSSYAG